MNGQMPHFLGEDGVRLLLFGGKGGVGKTTCAVAAALHLAARSPNRSFLLVSADPAHSLNDSLNGIVPASLPNLETLELDAAGYLTSFRNENGARLREIAASGTFLDDQDINRFLDLSLPGLDELMAFLEITAWVEAGSWDCIIVDTAPTGHTLRLLAMPELIRKWVDMLEALLAKRRYMRRVFSRSSRSDQLDEFVAKWKTTLRRMEALLRDGQRMCFVPVAIAESLSVNETLDLYRELRQRGIHAPELVVNRLYPAGDCPVCDSAHRAGLLQIERLLGGLGPAVTAWGLPVFATEVRGAVRLGVLWQHTAPVTVSATPPQPRTWTAPSEIMGQALLPADQMQFILFAGKGGVGKTTMACATALRLSMEHAGARVLLFSTDPAHSLSDCLHVTAGPKPIQIRDGCSALEIDAHAKFAELKARYAEDLHRFLQAVCSGFDLTFDRVVLERMLDLAPPGLDEVMALTHVMDLLVHDSYDVFVLDAAATGHLIRLLEMPDLINDWLKAFFSLFLKYERILRLPTFEDQLVSMSRNLKRLRSALHDPARSMVCVVSIPTQMALAETRDLVAACARLGISTPSLYLNMITPAGACALCSSRRATELAVAAEFKAAFPDLRQTLIGKQGSLEGLDRLIAFGERLYVKAAQEVSRIEA